MDTKKSLFVSIVLMGAIASFVGCDKANGPSHKVAIAEDPAPKPWTPPATTLPKAFVEETAFLLAHGMGDPRGGTYGAAFADLGSPWGRNDKPVEIHGWIRPGEPKRIVSLGGLVYDVRSPGGSASLGSDVMNLVGTATPGMAKTWMPLAGADHETAARLLLVLGEVEMAERIVKALPTTPFTVQRPFLVRWFHQAVEAHMTGDDRTALRVACAVLRERPAFTRRLTAQVDPRSHALPNGQIVEGDPYGFLDVLPALVEDSERRLSAPPRPPIDLKKASVTELIERLDEVSARQWGQPGGVNLVDDPIVAALAAKGAEAAEPLLDAMERDKRLTRSVSFGRDFFPGRNLIPVRSAALAAFQAFAQTDSFPAGAVNRLDVPSLRAYWAANKGKSGPDRWFDTLADDAAGWRRWEEAAQRLFDPVGTRRMGSMSQGPTTGKPYAEAVRGRSNPSLGDLLARRARDMVKPDNSPDGGGVYDVERSLQFATWLGGYDPAHSVDVLREMTALGLAKLASGRGDPDLLLDRMVAAFEARWAAGDADAWKDYAPMLTKVERFPSFKSTFLRPLVDHAELPEIREATRLLTTPGSVYDAVGRLRKEPGVAGYDSIVVSPLLKLPSMRKAVLRALDDRTVIGASWVDDRGNGWFEAEGKPFPSQGVRPEPTDLKPKAGERQPIRMADVMAHDLARLKGAPRFQPFWTVAEKDRAIGKIRAFLVANEGRVDAIVPWPNNWKTGAEEMAGR